MDKERYNWLRFMDRVFPDIPPNTKVKVLDKRFKEGCYYGTVKKCFWDGHHPFHVYVIRTVNRQTRWVYRDHLEVIQDEE